MDPCGDRCRRFVPIIEAGTDSRFLSTDTIFTDVTAPGLATQPTYVYSTVFVDIDYRDQPGNPHRGGFWRATFGSWDDRNLQRYDFRRFDGEAAHFFPLSPRDVFAAHAVLSYVNNETGHRVPFYALPYVGGADTIRAFDEFRFRDENALAVSAEYRRDLHRYVEGVLFVDGGEVRRNWNDIDFRDWKWAYGAGARIKAANRVIFRADIGAGGGEGAKLFLKFGKSF